MDFGISTSCPLPGEPALIEFPADAHPAAAVGPEPTSRAIKTEAILTLSRSLAWTLVLSSLNCKLGERTVLYQPLMPL